MGRRTTPHNVTRRYRAEPGLAPCAGPGRSGFTLLELLLAVVILGVLAAIAIPRFASTKEKAYLAKMQSDLRNLATAQEAYSADSVVYYGGSIPSSLLAYDPSPAGAIRIVEVVAGGWSARATMPGLTSWRCAIYAGAASPLLPATTDGVIECGP